MVSQGKQWQLVYLSASEKTSKPDIGQHCSAVGTRTTNIIVCCGISLHKGGLFSHCPKRCILLTAALQRQSLQWCQEHKDWASHQLSHVGFTDKKHFCLSCNYQHLVPTSIPLLKSAVCAAIIKENFSHELF
ncbi:hypothetical protein TNCV_4322371 [Trichonephila clavipes]|uniref:Uncharacterized protein n=1 Tax=Trichonephila clavipes TaxID=2585209 RepID=A0A8X6VEE0_TRICX|nr:hypothetical protein TNCV_4322371 [Trichonephila clavipes]